jgi:hypothetical protein
MRARTIAATLTTLSLALVAAVAGAEEKKAPPARRGEITLETIVIPGRVQRPQAVVDVNRLVPRAPLPELRKSLVDRIGNAIEKDPF